MFVFESLSLIRKNTFKAIEVLNEEQLNKIPEGRNNNLLWHLGHMVASQQILCYKLGGASMILPTEFIDDFKKGTSPRDWKNKYTLNQISEYFATSEANFEKDYKAGKMNNYQRYETSAGVVLNSIEDALIYSYGHENLHYGCILEMKKLVR